MFDDLGITADGGLLPDEHEVLWRGTRRKVDVVFGNVRDEAELTNDMLRASGDRWKLVARLPVRRRGPLAGGGPRPARPLAG